MLVRMTALVEGLVVRPERMRENIERGLGLHASSRVLVALVEEGGLSREEAYAIVQRASLRAADERSPLRDLLAVDPAVAERLSLTQLDACFDDAAFLRHVPQVIARLDGLAEGLPRGPQRRRRQPMLAEPFLRSGKVRDLYRCPTDGSCSSRRTGSPPSTSSCRRRSRTRGGCSPACPGSGLPTPRPSSPTISSPPISSSPRSCAAG